MATISIGIGRRKMMLLIAAVLWILGVQADPETHKEACEAEATPDYLIIGAGGSGLQTALFMEKYNYTYAVLEKESIVGSFWTQFPRFGELISVNKWVRNETQKLKYDWHSMLEAPLGMLDITEDYFPRGRDWHIYMSRVAEEAGLNIEFNVEVQSIASDGTPCVTLRDGTTRCARRRLFVGTGLVEKKEHLLEAFGGIPYSQITKQQCRHRKVCILGNGNSGWEVAQNVFNTADRVTLYGNQTHRFSAVTRYTGDVRVKFLQVLENLNGKLLDTVEYFHSFPSVKGLEKVMNEEDIQTVKLAVRSAAWLKQYDCETFVITTGFESHVPGRELESRFPATTDWYAAKENPSVHYIGWLMHERDFRKGAGGFLSGYRYLIRNLMHHVRSEDHGVPYPYKVLTKDEVVAHAMARIQVGDDLIILQDGVVLKDMIVPRPEEGKDVYHYYEGITYEFHKEFSDRDDVISLYFMWGEGRTVNNVFDSIVRYSDTKTLINLFLHPVIEVGGLARDIHEDLDMAWLEPAYVVACENVVREAVNGNLTKFREKQVYPFKHAEINQTVEPGFYEAAPLSSGIDPKVFQALWKAVYRKYTPREIGDLRAAFKEWMPNLFDFDKVF